MSFDLETAYIGLESPKPEGLSKYLNDVVGLMPAGATTDGALSWRNDHKVHRLWVRQGKRTDAVCTGFEARDAQAYERVCASLRKIGAQLTEADAAARQARRVKAMVSCDTPWGVPLELVLGLEEATQALNVPHFPRGFVTKGQGFGHFVFVVNTAADYEASRRFALEGMGLGLSDWLRLPLEGGAEMHVSFFHGNPRHHSMAIAFAPMPVVERRLHHINFEVSEVLDVGLAYERALKSGTPLANTIGQHANDRMVSFYSVSPDGWMVEIGATGLVVHENWNGAREYDRISEWGHQPPPVLTQMLGA